MNTRLQHFLTAENISQAQLADTIHVARASVSHILAGRNKPGFDFIESLGRHYPGLNLEWLITGRGKMYKAAAPAPEPAPLPEPPAEAPAAQETEEEPVLDLVLDKAPEAAAPLPPAPRRIRKVLVFYDDNTYAEL